MKKRKLQKKLTKTKKRLAKALSELDEMRSRGGSILAASVPLSLQQDDTEREIPVSGDELFETGAAAKAHSVGSN